jgi:hypothetical protein
VEETMSRKRSKKGARVNRRAPQAKRKGGIAPKPEGGPDTRDKTSAGDTRRTGVTKRQNFNCNVFVYLAADNNLADEMVWSLLSMAELSERFEQSGVALTAIYDPSGQNALEYRFPRSGASRAGGLEEFGGPVSPLAKLSGLTTYDQLRHFIDEHLRDRELYRQDASVPTVIILSGHGSGISGMLNEDHRRGALTVPQLGDLLAEALRSSRAMLGAKAEKIKILGLDACATGMIELCYEVKDSVDFVVGTESFVQNSGWPYQHMLAPLLKGPRGARSSAFKNAAAIATRMAKAYARYYNEYGVAGVSTDISVVELKKLDKVVRGLGDLVRLLRKELEGVLPQAPIDTKTYRREAVQVGRKTRGDVLLSALTVAHWSAQSYGLDGFVDLADWIVELQRALVAAPGDFPKIVKTGTRVLAAIGAAVKTSMYQGPAYQHSHGLSIYFPASRSRYDRLFERLAFDRETGWSGFLKDYLEKSRRGIRKEKGKASGDVLYPCEYDDDQGDVPAPVTLPGPSVRNPPDGGARNPPDGGARNPPDGGARNPPDGVARLVEAYAAALSGGYTKNGPRRWYRDLRWK